MKRSILFILLVISLSLSSFHAAPEPQQTGQTQAVLSLLVQAGNRNLESIAFFIKQELAAIGIDVDIYAKPFGQYLGDLYHYSTSRYNIMLATLQFSPEVPRPWDEFYSSSDFGSNVYLLNHTDVEQAQGNNTIIKQSDELLNQIRQEFDLVKKQQLIAQYTDLYMNSLLYSIPLVSPNTYLATHRGYGMYNPDAICNCTSDLWNPQEGLLGSRKLGAAWDPANPSGREGEANTTNLAISDSSFFPFDPVFNPNYDADLLDLTSTSLLNVDGNYTVHPGVASNVFVSNQTGSAKEYSFLIDTSAWNFNRTFDYQNSPVASEAVDANDFAFTLHLLEVMGGDYAKLIGLPYITGYNVSTTIVANDTLNVFTDQPVRLAHLGQLVPYPEHLLNKTLHTSTGQEIAPLAPGFDQSQEWTKWRSIGGYTAAGGFWVRMPLIDSVALQLVSRSDFSFPNEQSTAEFYQTHQATLDAAYSFNASYFAPQVRNTSRSTYWNFADNSTTAVYERPTTQGTELVNLIKISDINARLTAFNGGSIDLLKVSPYGSTTVTSFVNDPDIVVKKDYYRSHYFAVLDLAHPLLKEYNARRAIAMAINREKLVDVFDSLAEKQDSPINRKYGAIVPEGFVGAGDNGSDLSWYVDDYAIDYNVTKAQELLATVDYTYTPPSTTSAPFSPTTTSTASSSSSTNTSSSQLTTFSSTSTTPSTTVKGLLALPLLPFLLATIPISLIRKKRN